MSNEVPKTPLRSDFLEHCRSIVRCKRLLFNVIWIIITSLCVNSMCNPVNRGASYPVTSGGN